MMMKGVIIDVSFLVASQEQNKEYETAGCIHDAQPDTREPWMIEAIPCHKTEDQRDKQECDFQHAQNPFLL